jgi:hypothetical protein
MRAHTDELEVLDPRFESGRRLSRKTRALWDSREPFLATPGFGQTVSASARTVAKGRHVLSPTLLGLYDRAPLSSIHEGCWHPYLR